MTTRKGGWALATQEKKAEVLRLWALGKRVRECGRATGLPDGSIWNILEKAGHKPGGRVPIRKCALIKQLLAEGASVRDAAAQTQTSVDYARQCRREMEASK